jgi:hypothetical protein
MAPAVSTAVARAPAWLVGPGARQRRALCPRDANAPRPGGSSLICTILEGIKVCLSKARGCGFTTASRGTCCGPSRRRARAIARLLLVGYHALGPDESLNRATSDDACGAGASAHSQPTAGSGAFASLQRCRHHDEGLSILWPRCASKRTLDMGGFFRYASATGLRIAK